MSTARTMTTGEMAPGGQAASEAVARWIWPGLVVGLLGMQICMGMVAVSLATGDPTSRVIPHYHDRAIHWDSMAAARIASDQLGWKETISYGSTADVYGNRDLIVDLIDKDGKPVTGAKVACELWHHARPGDVLNVACEESSEAPGRYDGRARLGRSGTWQAEVTANRSSEKYFRARELNWSF